MVELAHIVNPVNLPPERDYSDLGAAQRLTLASLEAARQAARGVVPVTLLAVCYPEDGAVVPAGFETTRFLDRSVLELQDFAVPRKLPILSDILTRAAAQCDADYFIYTNIDIGVLPSFYPAVAALIRDGVDTFTITRRTIPRVIAEQEDLALACALVGDPHPGEDCFVFPRRVIEEMILDETCVGAQYLVPPLLANMICRARAFRRFREFHLTFHLGDDRVWQTDRFRDYADFNFAQAGRTLRRLHAAGALVNAPLIHEWIDKYAPDLPRPDGPVQGEAVWRGLARE